MKKTFLALVSLTAIASIALLSCSSDSSNPLAEELNLPQEQTLQKIIPTDVEQGQLPVLKNFPQTMRNKHYPLL